MTVIASIAAAASFLIGLAAGWLFLVPFNKLIVNTFTRAIAVSVIALTPMGLGAVLIGLIAELTASDRHQLGLAYLIGMAAWVTWDRLTESRRKH